MTLAEIKTLLSSTGLPVAYLAFPAESSTEMPFITFQETGTNNVIADDKVYKKVRRIQIDLFTKGKDEASETLLETALSDYAWDCVQTWTDLEDCNRLTYEIEID